MTDDALTQDAGRAVPRRTSPGFGQSATGSGSGGGPGGLATALGSGGGAPALMETVGGVHGLLEAVVPITVFSAVYGVSRDLEVSVVTAVVCSVLFTVWRLVRRESLIQAVSGLLGVGLGAFIATRTGQAEDFFLPNILKNIAYGAVYAVSALVRWPLIGLILGFFLGEGLSWRQVPERRRAYSRVTWLWAGMFGLRLAVEVPLWAAGMTVELGTLSVFLGLPLFAAVVGISWLMLRRVPTVVPEPDLKGGKILVGEEPSPADTSSHRGVTGQQGS